jgi:hypothetical protein
MMKYRTLPILILLSVCVSNVQSQTIKLEKSKLHPVGVSMSIKQVMGKQAVKVVRDSSIKTADQPTYVKVSDVDFKNGTIEVNVLSRLLPNAGPSARGFIGIAFRINDSNSKFECIYIRPTNGRADDQLRRNHSIQYFSYPGYDFDRFRREAPGVYESYADMGLNEWIKLKVEVKGDHARFYVNGTKQPALIVNDLKHGPDLSGSIGFWVDGGTEGYFSGLTVRKSD